MKETPRVPLVGNRTKVDGELGKLGMIPTFHRLPPQCQNLGYKRVKRSGTLLLYPVNKTKSPPFHCSFCLLPFLNKFVRFWHWETICLLVCIPFLPCKGIELKTQNMPRNFHQVGM